MLLRVKFKIMLRLLMLIHINYHFSAQRDCMALEINEDTKKHKKEKVQTSSRSTQTTSSNNKSPTMAMTNNAVNTISSMVENGPAL